MKPRQLLPQELIAQWHPTKNAGIEPTQVTSGSSKKVWRLDNNCRHEWEATISNRTYHQSKCPVCAGQKVLIGFNDLASVRPDIAKEWHSEKNGELLPTQITIGAGRKVLWRCTRGHEWNTPIKIRAVNKRNCPYCVNQKILIGFNDLATTQDVFCYI